MNAECPHYSSPRYRGVTRLIASLAIGAAISLGAISLPILATSAPAFAATCQTAAGTGLTAAVVATSGQTIKGVTVNAAQCDLGIFVGPNTTGVTIENDTVENANDHGIFVQDASNITIDNNNVTNNGLKLNPKINEAKAIELVGTTDSTVTANIVTNNDGGGIGIADDGPQVDPGAPQPSATKPIASTNDAVSGNTISKAYGGCGIVLASYDPGAGISKLTVEGNNVVGMPGVFGPEGPIIGSIVVAADEPATSVSDITVTNNTVTSGFIPLVVHSNAPKDTVTGVSITNNHITNNDWAATDGPPVPAAIIVAATQIPAPVTPTITGTTISGNTISQDFYGVWIAGATGTGISGNSISVTSGGSAVFDVPEPGSGYWLAGSNGSIYTFGDAKYYGSLGGVQEGSSAFPSPIVGIAATPDQGGYWLVGSNGSIYTFGDAKYYGSLGGVQEGSSVFPSPIVGNTAIGATGAA